MNLRTFSPTPDDQRFGLFPMSDQQAKWGPDIVAVHGLGGDYERSWTSSGRTLKVLWLRDLLPFDLPNSRVFSFGYDGPYFKKTVLSSFSEHAQTLLQYLSQQRAFKAFRSRPIIFVAHSMGGVVVKEV
jgi:pimeloyl-ACP methyl ester carboxylesterase